MTEPTTDELAYWGELHHWDSVFATPGPADECRVCNVAWPCPTSRLLALVAAQAGQIAEMEGEVLRLEGIDFIHAGCAGLREKDNAYLIAERERAEAAIARVRALCDRADRTAEGRAGFQPYDVRAILDGTEAPA